MTTVNQRLKKLFVTNPMRMEVTRFRSRFLNVTASPAINKAMVGTAFVGYLFLLGFVVAFRTDTPCVAIVLLQTVLLMLAAPAAAHGAIAGERDRRSWDLLQVAPITQDEIVVGKFMGVVTLLAGLQLAFLPAVLVTWICYASSPNASFLQLLVMEGISLAAGAASAAYTLYLSAKLKSANATLATAITSLVGVYVLLPMGFAYLLQSNNKAMDILMVYHPFWAILRVIMNSNEPIYRFMNGFYGIFTILLYLGFTGFLLNLTGRVLKKRAGKE